MNLLLPIATLITLFLYVSSQCSYYDWDPDPTAILSDIDAIQTLSVVEVLWYNNCTQVVTAIRTVYISASAFTASPIIFTFVNPQTPVIITHNFPDVTLTSLSVGETITYSETYTGTDAAIVGNWEYTVVVPPQPPSITKAPATTTTTTTTTVTTGSGGVSKAEVGGIAGGIVGGFLLIGALAFFFILRASGRSSRYEDMPENRGNVVQPQNYEEKRDGGQQSEFGNVNFEEPVSGRVNI